MCVIFLFFAPQGSSDNCFGNENCEQEFIDAAKANSRKALPSFLSCIALSLGSADRLLEVSDSIGFIGATFNLSSSILNTYNWYIDRDSIKGFAHHTLNGLSSTSNFASSLLAYFSAISTDAKQKNAYGAASSILGAFGLFFKGIDLFLTTTPVEDYHCRKEKTRRCNYEEL